MMLHVANANQACGFLVLEIMFFARKMAPTISPTREHANEQLGNHVSRHVLKGEIACLTNPTIFDTRSTVSSPQAGKTR